MAIRRKNVQYVWRESVSAPRLRRGEKTGGLKWKRVQQNKGGRMFERKADGSRSER